MKKLSFDRMENVEGGGWIKGIDTACTLLGGAAIVAPVIAANPVGVGALVLCGGWGIGRLLGSL